MFPAFSLVIVAPTGGEEMEMGVVLPMAAMRVEDRDGAPPQRLAPDFTSSTVSELPFVYVQWSQAIMLFPVIEACKLVAL